MLFSDNLIYSIISGNYVKKEGFRWLYDTFSVITTKNLQRSLLSTKKKKPCTDAEFAYVYQAVIDFSLHFVPHN